MSSFTRFAAVFIVLLAACSPPGPPATPKPDLAAEEKAIREADAAWLQATQARDAAREATTFASDGIAYREHVDPLIGPAAYQAFETKFWADNPKANLTWTTDAINVVASGDVAIQTGVFQIAGLGPKGDVEDKGRFVTVWKKINGDWKVAHDIGLTTMPLPPAEKK